MQAEAPGRILSLYVRPSQATPVREVERCLVEQGQGLAGDHAGAGRREVTLVDEPSWRAACAELGVEVPPGSRRANVFVGGMRLAPAIGRRLRVGPTLLEVLGELHPCELMDRAQPGLHAALRPEGRGGVHCRVLEGGEIAVGDEVRVEDA
ncbi:MAG: MOSC domain-containing protein [Planctomycetota bacterium]